MRDIDLVVLLRKVKADEIGYCLLVVNDEYSLFAFFIHGKLHSTITCYDYILLYALKESSRYAVMKLF